MEDKSGTRRGKSQANPRDVSEAMSQMRNEINSKAKKDIDELQATIRELRAQLAQKANKNDVDALKN